MKYEVFDDKVSVKDENTGKIIAEVTYPLVEDGVVDIDHTFVDPSLKGQGVGEKLMAHAVEKIKEKNYKVRTSCSYAKKLFEKKEDYAELLK